MMTLFIDTSQSDVSIAIVLDKKILASRCMRIPNKHSVYTVSFIDDVLKEASVSCDDVDKIMVVNGPGSFTGVRIGLTIAKVYAYIKNIPLVCLSSLKILALSTNHDYCLSIIDAKHDNYYIGLYDKNNNEVIPEQFANITYVRQLISKYDPGIFSYDEFKLDDLVVSSRKLDILKIVSYYEKMKSVNVHLAVPNYLKLPQALEGKNV